MSKERLELLRRAVQEASRILIVTHNDPDPDAIASAVALQYLLSEVTGINAQFAYRGIIGRAENRALVRYPDHPLKRLASADVREGIAIALVDTQPSAGNNPLPSRSTATLILDHHPLPEETVGAEFADVRPAIGATSTMLVEYLQAAGTEPPARLATALFYGIKTDTMGLVRGASPADVAAYIFNRGLTSMPCSRLNGRRFPLTAFKSWTRCCTQRAFMTMSSSPMWGR